MIAAWMDAMTPPGKLNIKYIIDTGNLFSSNLWIFKASIKKGYWQRSDYFRHKALLCYDLWHRIRKNSLVHLNLGLDDAFYFFHNFPNVLSPPSYHH